MEAALSPRQERGQGVARSLVLGGSALLVLSAFLPQEPAASALVPPDILGDTLWTDGLGWPLVAAGAMVGLLALRGRIGASSWLCLGVGLLGALNALALAAQGPVGTGVVVLGLGAALLLAGWAVGFAATRPQVAGLGPWSGLAGRIAVAGASKEVVPRGEEQRGGLAALWALLGYGALSVALWGLPVLGDFSSTLIAENPLDPGIYTWFYAWWPHALTEGLNPFLTEAIFAPEGYNLSWVTAVPGPSLLMAPITLALGPVVTYNLLALAAPPLAAWTAFLLCRHLTGAMAPALAGGFVFGFSPYMLRMLEGSPHLYFVALVPLFVLLVVRRLEGSLSERALFGAFAVGVAVQFLTSNDVLATMTVFGSLALAAAFALYPERRALLLRTAGVLAAAYAAAAVLVSPVIFFMLFHEHTTPEQNTPFFANDLVSWFLPDSRMLVADSHEPGGTELYFGGLGYFGIPLLVLVVLFAWERWRSRSGRLILFCFAAPALAGLGHRLTVAGEITAIGLPWAAVDHFPGLELLVPQRFSLYAFLAGAVMAALWLRGRPGVARWALAALVALTMLPWVRGEYWDTPVHTPAFFSSGAYERYLDTDDRVASIGIIGDYMRWQAEERFPYALAGGGVGAFPASYTRYPIFGALSPLEPLPPGYERELRRFLADKGVSAIVVDKRYLDEPRRRLLATLDARPLDAGGVLLYRL